MTFTRFSYRIETLSKQGGCYQYVIDLSIMLLAFDQLVFIAHIMCLLILELIENLLSPKPCKILKHDEVIFIQLTM